MGDKQCIHYWILANKNVGRCRHCGAVKDFGALLREESKKLNQWHAEVAWGIAGQGKRRGRPPALRED